MNINVFVFVFFFFLLSVTCFYVLNRAFHSGVENAAGRWLVQDPTVQAFHTFSAKNRLGFNKKYKIKHKYYYFFPPNKVEVEKSIRDVIVYG